MLRPRIKAVSSTHRCRLITGNTRSRPGTFPFRDGRRGSGVVYCHTSGNSARPVIRPSETRSHFDDVTPLD